MKFLRYAFLALAAAAALASAAAAGVPFNQLPSWGAVPYLSNGDGTYSPQSFAPPTGASTAANQTAPQANPGSDATKALAVQGCAGCKAVSVQPPRGLKLYVANVSGYAAYATPTDLFCLPGSATRTVYPLQVFINVHATAATLVDLYFVKRSTANSGGTPTALTAMAYDSANGAATTAPVTYAAAPSLGTALGTLSVWEGSAATATTVSLNSISNFSGGSQISPLGVALALHGTGEELCVNFAGVALPSGLSATITVQWMEEVP